MSSQDFFRTFRLRELNLPLELVELDSDLQADMGSYREEINSRYSCDLSSQWLPMSSVRVDKNEGLSFPASFEKFRSLLLREIELEGIPTPDPAVLYGTSTNLVTQDLRMIDQGCLSLAV